jgi:predicted NBD/HSP70 family sugar kinase
MFTGKPQLNRIVNRRLILEMIRRKVRISRADLAKMTAIRPPTVSAVVRELIEEGFVEEVGAGATSGGRAPRIVALNDRRPLALGFELSETCIHAGLCGVTGKLNSKLKVLFQPSSPEAAVDCLQQLGDQLLGEHAMKWNQLAGVGVALPGRLSQLEGLISWSRPLSWRNVPFKQLCEARWKVETDIVNDSFAGGMAAHRFEVDPPVENLVFLYLRFLDVKLDVLGVGVGLIINGEPYYGESGAAGEITTSPMAHPMALLAEQGQSLADVEAFAALVESRHPESLRAIQSSAAELVPLVIHIINLLDPGVLIFGSDMPMLRDEMLPALREALVRSHPEIDQCQTELRASALGDFGVVRGVTVPTLQRLFRMPQWT